VLPNPSLLVRPAIRREAVSTSALEGTYATIGEVLEADFLDDAEVSHPVREVQNYVKATERGLELIKERPISRNMLNELHDILVKGTRGDSVEAGKVRQGQVVIGPDGCRVSEARFVPPPADERLDRGIDDWEKWINAEGGVTPLFVRLALGHYQFETLHPYRDGNGRLGRLVAILQLVDAGALHHPVLNISPWFEARRSQYQDQLAAVSETGDFDAWVTFFCEALRSQAVEAIDRITRLEALRDKLVAKVRGAGIRSVAVQIAEDLIGFPALTVTLAAEQHHVSFQTANTAVARLTALGILHSAGGKSYDRVFIAPEVMKLLSE
jgi:Fic family protein